MEQNSIKCDKPGGMKSQKKNLPAGEKQTKAAEEDGISSLTQ